jgi:hypothetical protein
MLDRENWLICRKFAAGSGSGVPEQRAGKGDGPRREYPGRATRQEGTVLKRRPENRLSTIKVDEPHHKRVRVGMEKTLRKSDCEMTPAAISFGLE